MQLIEKEVVDRLSVMTEPSLFTSDFATEESGQELGVIVAKLV